ncbi:helix-turn-helix domain-containing protein [Pedococcus sp.]|jgi:AcrR family transcriptional regulator|uniref:TetR/AcrR family transcriptional regulator n=1 Tax=Pedococcus sp. TaxID=2860345 RepID=UPI002E10BE69|nr:helix-turn-helix domain-containing protein [Pedococcus sp.]
MSSTPLSLLGGPPPERADAARNREALLAAASRLVERCGVDAMTMDAVAHEAGVGKGTVFRRFESRAGLMGALLNQLEATWQSLVISGPPPLGPGAAPMDRLLAFGRSRLEYNLRAAQLIAASGQIGRGSLAARSFTAQHVVHLLGLLEVRGDRAFLGLALLAPLESVVVEQAMSRDGFPVEQFIAGWQDLARRIVAS